MLSDNEVHIQLFQLPFAGGSSASFTRMTDFLDKRIEPITVEYSGRLTRRKEPFIKSYEDFLKDVSEYISIRRKADLPYAIFAYSMGCELTYDILRLGLLEGNPKHVFLCAKGSLKGKYESYQYGQLPIEEFINKMIQLGGIEERMLSNKRYLAMGVAPMKNDFIILGQYKYYPYKLPCDMTVIYSPQDNDVVAKVA